MEDLEKIDQETELMYFNILAISSLIISTNITILVIIQICLLKVARNMVRRMNGMQEFYEMIQLQPQAQ